MLANADDAFSFQNCAKLSVSVLLMVVVGVAAAVLTMGLVLAELVEDACASVAAMPSEAPPPQLVRSHINNKIETKNLNERTSKSISLYKAVVINFNDTHVMVNVRIEGLNRQRVFE